MNLRIWLCVISILGLLTRASAAFGDPEEISIPTPVSKIFAPIGFDDNDTAEVVLHGKFPNTCYRVGDSSYTVDHDNRTVNVKASSYAVDAKCAQVITPFIQVVKLGILGAGRYEVLYANDASVDTSIEITKRTAESPDDFLYAPVQAAKILVDANGRQLLELRGSYPLLLIGCAYIKEIRMRRDVEDILVVQPIMDVTMDCEEHQIRFKKQVGLSSPFKDEGLLHVRIINGQSLNQYVAIEP